MHMARSHERHTYFMTNKFTKSIHQRLRKVGQTVLNSELFKVKVGLKDTAI